MDVECRLVGVDFVEEDLLRPGCRVGTSKRMQPGSSATDWRAFSATRRRNISAAPSSSSKETVMAKAFAESAVWRDCVDG